jgi:hypothetical protein
MVDVIYIPAGEKVILVACAEHIDTVSIPSLTISGCGKTCRTLESAVHKKRVKDHNFLSDLQWPNRRNNSSPTLPPSTDLFTTHHRCNCNPVHFIRIRE